MGQQRTLSELNQQVFQFLAEKFGVVDTIRFVNQFTNGSGDYTVDREALVGHLTLEEIKASIHKKRDEKDDGR
jgi:hypothetical protein